MNRYFVLLANLHHNTKQGGHNLRGDNYAERSKIVTT